VQYSTGGPAIYRQQPDSNSVLELAMDTTESQTDGAKGFGGGTGGNPV
jgi:hypothetical protein